MNWKRAVSDLDSIADLNEGIPFYWLMLLLSIVLEISLMFRDSSFFTWLLPFFAPFYEIVWIRFRFYRGAFLNSEAYRKVNLRKMGW